MFKNLFKPKALKFVSPMEGTLISLDDVNDPVFSSKAMGDGFAIKLTGNTVVSPVDGEIVAVFPTKHAIGVKGTDDNEYLIHIGVDTVYLKGEGFELHVGEGEKVKQGDLLLTLQLDVMKDKNIDLTSPVIITNLEGRSVKLLHRGPVNQLQGDILSID